MQYFKPGKQAAPPNGNIDWTLHGAIFNCYLCTNKIIQNVRNTGHNSQKDKLQVRNICKTSLHKRRISASTSISLKIYQTFWRVKVNRYEVETIKWLCIDDSVSQKVTVVWQHTVVSSLSTLWNCLEQW